MKTQIRKIIQLFFVLPLFILSIAACGQNTETDIATAQALAGTKLAETATASVPTSTATTLPTATATVTLTPTTTPTLEPTPFGGGGQIAFASNRDGNYEIYLMNPDGGEQKRITNNEHDDNEPAWSTDRVQIAFVASFGDGRSGLYVSQADGSNPTLIVKYENLGSPSWSSDGQIIFSAHICVFRCDGDTTNCNGCYRDYLTIINSDGSKLSVFDEEPTNIYAPDFSPNGFEVVATRDNTIQLIRLGRRGGTNIVNFRNSQDGAWSPDGTHVAFSSFQDGNYEIYIVEFATGEITRLTESSGFDLYPTWSPDGTKITFASKRDGNWEIYVMNVDGSNLVRLTDNPADDIEPAWAP